MATENKIPNVGLDFFGNRAVGTSENALDTTNGNVSWRNGTSSLSVTDTMTIFNADGTGGTKTLESVSYNNSTKKITINAFLSSTEGNTPGTITKIAIDNSSGSGKLISEHKFDAVTKNSSKEFYFTVEMLLSDNS